jgi:predicted acetyltransferase
MTLPKITLRHLTIEDKEKFLEAKNADWESDFSFAHYWDDIAGEDFTTFIKVVPEFSLGMHIPKEHVPCTFLFAFNENEELVGRTSIRHELNEHLLKVGGHIGYGVVPAHRKKGYASSILKESLGYVRINLPKVDKALVTCDEGNIGSQKTIEKNNGEFENIVDVTGEKSKRRYWIKL